MPDHCVAPDKCGGDTGYYVGGLGHPVPGEGIVGRTFYYASSTNCKASALNGHILNCGNKDDGDDFIYRWTKPSGCDRVFCAEQDPCSSTVYKKLEEDGRAARAASTDKISDNALEHGWYRFPRDEGIMARSTVLPGHSGITYPGWYDGEHPLEEGQEKTGKACFSYNGNPCWQQKPVSVRNCKNFYVYHLQKTGANYGYTFEQDVCKLETMKLDQEWRLQYNLDAVALTDSSESLLYLKIILFLISEHCLRNIKVLTHSICSLKHHLYSTGGWMVRSNNWTESASFRENTLQTRRNWQTLRLD